MKLRILASASLLTTISLASPSVAANPEHTRQLLTTKQCQACDLSNAGLVMANLAGANLRGADLSRANLSRANLMGADLTGANLTGASLFGANLMGANLNSANLNATDLRDTYLTQANLVGASLINANLLGATGLPDYTATAEDFYRLALAEAQRDNHTRAIELIDQALKIKPDLANAYLGRSMSRYQLGDRKGAIQDAQQAATLFSTQGDQQGYQLAQEIIKGIEKAQNAKKGQEGGNGIGSSIINFLGGLAGLAFQFIPFLF